MWTGPKKEMHDELYKRLGTKKEKSALSRLVRQRDRVGEKMRQRKRDRDRCGRVESAEIIVGRDEDGSGMTSSEGQHSLESTLERSDYDGLGIHEMEIQHVQMIELGVEESAVEIEQDHGDSEIVLNQKGKKLNFCFSYLIITFKIS